MTIEQKDKRVFTNFSKWINTNSCLDSVKFKLDIQNIDYMVHQYCDPVSSGKIEYISDRICKVMIVEEKCCMKSQSFSQRDTHSLLDQCLHNMSGNIVKTAKGKKYLQYYGYHLISFENTSPEDGNIFINYKKYTKCKLIKFFQFVLPESSYKCYFCKH